MNSSSHRSRVMFDPEDYELVELVNDLLDRGAGRKKEKRIFNPYLHPRGIKELAAPQQQRIAFAIVHLLDTLEDGKSKDRIAALRSVRDEVLHSSSASMRQNTARVLLEIMKQLVRERGHLRRQVELAHDFFAALSGKPVIIRRELANYHLLEMPESWNQVAFDHHVHDANTKGRKSPTHLIMDAWIKGIRQLTVIYYNHVRGDAVSELAEAAEIMGIEVEVGIEFSSVFRGKYTDLIWTPRGLANRQELLELLDEPEMQQLMADGLEVTRYERSLVLALLDSFNEHHRRRLNEEHGLELEPLSPDEFLEYVGVGQAAKAHLADFIHAKLLPLIHERVADLRSQYARASGDERADIEERIDALNHLIPETLVREYLRWSLNPDVPDPNVPRDGTGVPRLLRLSTPELSERLDRVRSGYSLTLNPSNLTAADVVELIAETEGAITHLEIFNLKDYKRDANPNAAAISNVRRVINDGNPLACKRLVQDLIADIQQSDDPEREARVEVFRCILRNLRQVIDYYSISHLRSRIGSDSIGRSRSLFGMGLVVVDTLPRLVQRRVRDHAGTREIIPMRTEVFLNTRWMPHQSPIGVLAALQRALRAVPGLRELGYRREESYVIGENVTRPDARGNIATLGGLEEDPDNGMSLAFEDEPPSRRCVIWRYINTNAKNALKVLIGFLPAFLTFYLTKEWWLLQYLGAVIWFGITGVRNVIQSIAAGRGFFKGQLQLNWNDLVSWERVTDSLLWTGFSVPLLDWLVKSLILDRTFDITTSTPVMLYTFLALANGVYLYSHNTIRGLPRAAAIGNFFRSVLSIPIAIGMNWALLQLMVAAGLAETEANLVLQKWAAVIGKAASDTVAGLIEGIADRSANMSTRRFDYREKLSQLFDAHGRLEVLFPEADVVEMLESSPKKLSKAAEAEAHELERILIVNGLDLMYLWMYKPRARTMFLQLLATASLDDRRIILSSQRVLESQRQVSELVLKGLVGQNFGPPLAFYLDKSKGYLSAMRELERRWVA